MERIHSMPCWHGSHCQYFYEYRCHFYHTPQHFRLRETQNNIFAQTQNINSRQILDKSIEWFINCNKKYIITNKVCSQLDQTCSICCSQYKLKQKLIKLFCLHKYHFNCLSEWFKFSTKCPLCKRDFRQHSQYLIYDTNYKSRLGDIINESSFSGSPSQQYDQELEQSIDFQNQYQQSSHNLSLILGSVDANNFYDSEQSYYNQINMTQNLFSYDSQNSKLYQNSLINQSSKYSQQSSSNSLCYQLSSHLNDHQYSRKNRKQIKFENSQINESKYYEDDFQNSNQYLSQSSKYNSIQNCYQRRFKSRRSTYQYEEELSQQNYYYFYS